MTLLDVLLRYRPNEMDRTIRAGSLAMTMPRIPRILFLVPGVLAGLLIPALTAAPKTAPRDAIGMTGDDFARDTVTIHEGQRITFVNNSRVIHVVGPGRGGRIIGTEPHVPMTGLQLMQTNSVYRTGPWKMPGTYYLTCSVHADMTLKVIVTP
jgi:plastocyanin